MENTSEQPTFTTTASAPSPPKRMKTSLFLFLEECLKKNTERTLFNDVALCIVSNYNNKKLPDRDEIFTFTKDDVRYVMTVLKELEKINQETHPRLEPEVLAFVIKCLTDRNYHGLSTDSIATIITHSYTTEKKLIFEKVKITASDVEYVKTILK